MGRLIGPMERLYVDTNVFIRLLEGNDELTNALAELFLIERPDSEPFLATSELTLAEALVKPYRNSDDRLIHLYDSWTISNPYLEVGPVDRQVLWSAAVLRSRYPSLKLPDAIHLSTAALSGCTHFLSGDERLSDRYDPRPRTVWHGERRASRRSPSSERGACTRPRCRDSGPNMSMLCG